MVDVQESTCSSRCLVDRSLHKKPVVCCCKLGIFGSNELHFFRLNVLIYNMENCKLVKGAEICSHEILFDVVNMWEKANYVQLNKLVPHRRSEAIP